MLEADRFVDVGHYPAVPAPLVGSSIAALVVGSRLLLGPPPLPATPPAAVPEPGAPETVEGPELEEAPETEGAPETTVDAEPMGPAVEPTVPVPEPTRGRDAELTSTRVEADASQRRGNGQFIAAGVFFASAFAFQITDAVVFDDSAIGAVERVLLLSGVGLAVGGGVTRGRADARQDESRSKRRDVYSTLVGGSALTVIGVTLGVVNEGMWWRCIATSEGFYEDKRDAFGLHDCNARMGRALLDVSAASTAIGVGLLSWSITYRRHRAKTYAHDRTLGLRPMVGRDRWGLGVGGRF